MYFIMHTKLSLFLTRYIPCHRLTPAVTMADSGKTNETGAAAAEPANGDQQVRRTYTQNYKYYKTQAHCVGNRALSCTEDLYSV